MMSIHNGILLESLDVYIDYNDTYDEIIEKFDRAQCSYDLSQKDYCRVTSTCFDCGITFWIALKFAGKKLIKIALLPINLENNQKSYARIQDILKKMLGKPPISQILNNFLMPDNQKSSWDISGVHIEHTLSDRFGFEDVVSIYVL